MIKKTIATLSVILLGFTALAEDQKDFFEEWLGYRKIGRLQNTKLSEEKANKLCNEVLKHEVDTPVFGNFYTKNGVVKFDKKNPETKAFLEVDQKCDIVKQTKRFLSVFTTYDLNDKYLISGYKYYSRFSEPIVFFVNKGSCQFITAKSHGSGYQDALFSYAIYNNELYGIYRPITVKYNGDIRDFQLTEKYPPTIVNLDTNEKIKSCSE